MTADELVKSNDRKYKIREIMTPHLVYPFNVQSEKWDEAGFCLEAIGLKKNALRCVSRKFWKDPDFCMEAVKRRGEAIEWVDEKILTQEMFLAAVTHDGTALYYVPKFSLTKLIITTAVKQNKEAIQYVPEEWMEEAKEALNFC